MSEDYTEVSEVSLSYDYFQPHEHGGEDWQQQRLSERSPLLPRILESRAGSLDSPIPSSEGSIDLKEIKKRKYHFYEMFRYADRTDMFLMIVGLIFAMAQGAAIPLGLWFNAPVINAMIAYAQCPGSEHNLRHNESTSLPDKLTDHFIKDFQNVSLIRLRNETNHPDIFDQIWPICLDVAFIGAAVFIAGVIHGTAWTVAGERQILRIRMKLFRAILSKDVAWFSERRAGELSNVLFDMVRKMEDGMTSRVSITLSWLCTATGAFATALAVDWQISIIVILLSPILFVSSTIFVNLIRRYSTKQMEAYNKAGAIASEVISNWKTVQTFSKQEHEVRRFTEHLKECKKMGKHKVILAGVGQGIKHFIIYTMAALTFYLGAQRHGVLEGGTLLVVFNCILNASNSLGNALPNFAIFATASAAIDEVYGIIDEAEDPNNRNEESGTVPESITGDILFDNVGFSYPERPDRKVLRSFSLRIPHGKTVAIVGPSGSGKSTVVQLLLRLYNVNWGTITIGDTDIHEVSGSWLRHQIGVVSQEPVLFYATIRENVCLGAVHRKDISDEEVYAVCKMANVHDFILSLPLGYDTMVGELGTQLSGGQKQRIAIARALIGNPSILVLDEATSALDSRSEALVQDALDKACRGRTTVIIAHRLSTVRNADVIAVVSGGLVVEIGKHDVLVEAGGLYAKLVDSQLTARSFDYDIEENAEEHLQIEDGEQQEAGDELGQLPFVSGKSTSVRRRSSRVKFAVPSISDAISMKDHEVGRDDDDEKQMGRLDAIKLGLKWSKDETKIIIGCAFLSMIVGAIDPTFQIFLSDLVTTFCPQGLMERTHTMIAIVFVLGILEAGTSMLQYYLYAIIGERLTARLRRRLLGKILRMDASWHDKIENQSSVLATVLSTDCLDIQGVSAIKICALMAVTVVVALSLIYSLVVDYRIALAAVPVMPLIVISGIAYTRVFVGIAQEDEKASKEGAVLAMDAIKNMRTVVSLNAENYFHERFSQRYLQLCLAKFRGGFLASFLQSLMFACIFFARAVVFTVGSYLMSQHQTSAYDVVCIFMLIGLCGFNVGRHSSVVPDEDRARRSAASISKILEHKNKIDVEDPKDGESKMAKELAEKRLLHKYCSGKIELKNVAFSYPNRPTVQVLNGISLTVEPGQFVAICGPSGSGKSTIVNLLQRFYDPTGGSVLVDDVDARALNVRWVRANMGPVAQDATLFALSIRENIAYGSKADKTPSFEEIERASKLASASEFIARFPETYETQVGENGSLLSGGQRQRVAIARALVRRPKILLFDEATSALDTESERIVQEAIDAARSGKTCLVIAHRLSTIKSADRILVIENGRVVEQGNHRELMQLQNVYFKMQNLES